MKTSVFVLPDHLLSMLMSAGPRKWTEVVASRVDTAPPRVAEVVDAADVGEETSRLRPVDPGELALEPSRRNARCCAESRFRLPELPNAGGLSSVHPAEVLRVLEDAMCGVPVAARFWAVVIALIEK